MPTVMIAGASRGLGLEMTRQYASDGWTVIATARDPGASPLLAAIAGEHPGRVQVVGLDVTEDDSIEALGARVRGVPIDVVVANAGVMTHQGFGRAQWNDFKRLFRINSYAPLRLAEVLLEPMLLGSQRKFAAVSSLLGSIGADESGGFYAYRASKAALNALLKALSIDLAKQGVTVLPLHPGWVKTDLGGPMAPLDATTSVAGLRRVIAGATAADSGRFIQYDGATLPW